MVFPSLQSEHPASYSPNALNAPPANSIYQRVLNFHNACTSSNTRTKDDSICTLFLSHTLFHWVLTFKLPIKTVAFGRSKSSWPQNKEEEGAVMKWKKSGIWPDCWKNNISQSFFPPELRERKAMIVFETVSCRNGGICGKKIKTSSTHISSNALDFV